MCRSHLKAGEEVVGLQPSEGLPDCVVGSNAQLAARRVIHVLHGEVNDLAVRIRDCAIDGEAIGQGVCCAPQEAVEWCRQIEGR